MHLVPMIRVTVFHKLAATKVANAENKLRFLNLAGKIAMLDLKKLLRTMNGHGIVEPPGLGCQHGNGRDGAPEMDMKMAKTSLVHPMAKQKRFDHVEECVESAR